MGKCRRNRDIACAGTHKSARARESESASERERRREIDRGGKASESKGERKMTREPERHRDELRGIRDKETVGLHPKS